jgi:hypothetical protein
MNDFQFDFDKKEPFPTHFTVKSTVGGLSFDLSFVNIDGINNSPAAKNNVYMKNNNNFDKKAVSNIVTLNYKTSIII